MNRFGQVNRYQCSSCGKSLYTMDVNVGFAPNMIPCWPDCGGTAISTYYDPDDPDDQDIVPQFELFRPEAPARWFKKAGDPFVMQFASVDEFVEYVLRGGLVLRGVAPALIKYDAD